LIIQGYYQLGDTATANKIAEKVKNNVYEEMEYFISLDRKYNNSLLYEKRVAFYSLDEIRRMASEFNQTELAKEMEQKLQEYSSVMTVPM